MAKFGRLDVVINNAGYALMGDTEVISESDARLQMETLFGAQSRSPKRLFASLEKSIRLERAELSFRFPPLAVT